MTGPVEGLRVLELATGVAGPYAGRLLTMLGADVVKVEPAGGDPARTLPVDEGEEADPSPVFVHLNAGKTLARSVPSGWADVVIDDHLRAELPATDGALLVSVTAWGIDADEAGHPLDEVRVQAASGMLAAVSDGGDPVRLPGWQTQYLAGAYAAASALAGLAAGARHVEVTWVGAAATGVEGEAAKVLHRLAEEEDDPRAGGIQSAAFPSGVFACADGYAVPGTVRPVDWTLQCGVYGRPDLLEDPRFDWRHRWENRDLLRAELDPWYRARTRDDIFRAALECGWAVGKVMAPEDVINDAHMAERRFLGRCGPALLPSRPWRAEGIAEGHDVDLAEPVPEPSVSPRPAAAPPRPPELGGLKVLELTWAWAGPFVGRFLAGFGADVVRIETGARPDGWRAPLRVDGELTWDAAPLHNSLNRTKRSASVDLIHPEGRDLFVALLAEADVFVVNMTASVLSDRGVEDDVRAAVESGLVALAMPSLGYTGPHRSMPGYGMLIEAMGGLADRFGPPEEGARVSSTYYPDAVAGVHGAVAVLAALTARRTSGRGSFIDLSQQEVMWMQLGEGIVLASRDGRAPRRMGNAEAGCPAPDGVVGLDQLAPSMVETLDHPVTGVRRYLAGPVVVDGVRLPTRRAPMFGEHTDDVLADWLGMDPDGIAGLRERGAVGSVPERRRR
ncbi:MAG TPA: CoA transferase [Acidimicrobiales bacterium]|nr:CoA transferase [Acidimicrobiales bacterium]